MAFALEIVGNLDEYKPVAVGSPPPEFLSGEAGARALAATREAVADTRSRLEDVLWARQVLLDVSGENAAQEAISELERFVKRHWVRSMGRDLPNSTEGRIRFAEAVVPFRWE